MGWIVGLNEGLFAKPLKPKSLPAQLGGKPTVELGRARRGPADEHLQYRAELAMNGKRVGLYLRVSTGDQTIETQRIGLVAACEARG